MGRTKAVSRRN